MPKKLSSLLEFRIFLILAIIALAWHLLTLLGSVLGVFTDIALILFLSWILSFILEPLVLALSVRVKNRITAAVTIYALIALLFIALIWIVLPTTILQLTQLTAVLPTTFPQNSLLSSQLQTFLATTLSNSASLVTQVASGVTGLVLVFILSFYLLISKKEISDWIAKLIPDEYEEDYQFLGNIINTTFASFLRIQVSLGLVLGFVTLVCLSILRVNFPLSTSIASAILAMIPVIGAVLFLLPPALAALTISVEKMVIVTVVLVLAAQLVYNFWAPKLFGQALKIHPIIVLLSFLVGYKIAGIWGAIFAVPITSALTIIGRDLIKYWQEEADK